MPATMPPLHFLTLPPEVREHIYTLLLRPDANRLFEPDEYTDYNYAPALVLFRLNRQIYAEARKVFRHLNIFVRIETPWPEAREHVQSEGHTPILMKKERAERFTGHTLNVVIDAPQSPIQDADVERFVIHLADLEKFTKSWYYADLSHPGLNSFLRLSLHLRDPYTPDWDEKRMPKWLQRALLLPFGMVKDLRETVITGDPEPLPSIETELRAEQAVPHKSAEYCLHEATRLKLEGNAALAKEDYTLALEKYREAWEAMHVVVKGRQRHIHADAFFGRELAEPPFEGKNGQQERLILRVHLVANTILVYLKLQDWYEATFWGMRTIRMLRQAMGLDENAVMPADEEAVLNFPAMEQMGKIYYRTGVAWRELGDTDAARRLLRVAAVYLPRDEKVRSDLGGLTLRLG